MQTFEPRAFFSCSTVRCSISIFPSAQKTRYFESSAPGGRSLVAADAPEIRKANAKAAAARRACFMGRLLSSRDESRSRGRREVADRLDDSLRDRAVEID